MEIVSTLFFQSAPVIPEHYSGLFHTAAGRDFRIVSKCIEMSTNSYMSCRLKTSQSIQMKLYALKKGREKHLCVVYSITTLIFFIHSQEKESLDLLCMLYFYREVRTVGCIATPTQRCCTPASRYLATYRPICVVAVISFFLLCASWSGKNRSCK